MVFEIASITKEFTAAAILLLQDRGKLSVEDEVTKYPPEYPTWTTWLSGPKPCRAGSC
jgi:CubicO group peptidase (beta-lactamase class C family)